MALVRSREPGNNIRRPRMKKILLFPITALFLLAGCATMMPAAMPPESSGPGQERLPLQREQILREAETYIGIPYNSPPNVPRSFDCSSFVSYVYSKFGYTLPRSTSSYGSVGRKTGWNDAQPGDILVFANVKGSNSVDHVGILYSKSASGELAGSLVIHAVSINAGASMLRGNPDSRTGIVITQLGLRGDGVIENEYFYQRFMYCTSVLK